MREAPRHDVIVAEPLASPDADARLGAHDAGRFCGLVGTTLLLMHTRALDDSVSNPSDLIEAADQRLYNAKRKGRNRTECGLFD